MSKVVLGLYVKDVIFVSQKTPKDLFYFSTKCLMVIESVIYLFVCTYVGWNFFIRPATYQNHILAQGMSNSNLIEYVGIVA